MFWMWFSWRRPERIHVWDCGRASSRRGREFVHDPSFYAVAVVSSGIRCSLQSSPSPRRRKNGRGLRRVLRIRYARFFHSAPYAFVRKPYGNKRTTEWVFLASAAHWLLVFQLLPRQLLAAHVVTVGRGTVANPENVRKLKSGEGNKKQVEVVFNWSGKTRDFTE